MSIKGPIVEMADIGTVVDAPFLLLPNLQRLFRRRAERLKRLEAGHSLSPYLRLIADLAEAQQHALDSLPPGTLPAIDPAAMVPGQRTAPLHYETWSRDASWRHALRDILSRLGQAAMPEAASGAAAALAAMDDSALEMLADRVLAGAVGGADLAYSCFVAAALQVYWSRMAALLDPGALGPLERQCDCPVCASPPVASLMPADSSRQRSRYLVCRLCAVEWRYVRIKCAHCQSTKGIAYQQIQGGNALVKAETCEECKTYTKLFQGEVDREVEPMADDLASLALDLLVSDAGWLRASPNLFLLPGEAAAH